jgi:predicted DNA-binding transcriptional regulator AlpA
MSVAAISEMYPPAEAAKILGIAEQTLALWRSTKRYPLSYVKMGRAIRYRHADLEKFIASRTVKPVTIEK